MSVVVATREREELLARCLAAIAAQHYEGTIEVVLVYDGAEPVLEHAVESGDRLVTVTRNQRKPGLAGARNTGIGMAGGSMVAFCDDDDMWRPDKLRLQVDRLEDGRPGACVSGISVHYGDTTVDRVPAVDAITAEMLTASRLTGAHPSSYLMTREMLDRVGWVDESIPGGYGEDYDWLLRLTAVAPVEVVREPLVDVLWHKGSYFSSRWDSMVASVDYLLEKYPHLRDDPRGLARLQGQRAFALAAQGRRREAAGEAWRAFRSHSREPRAYVAALVAAGVVKAPWVMHQANQRGRGI